jgi:hypothetical protein
MSKRTKRRNRWRQKAYLDQVALAKINSSFILSCDTWGGVCCPQCFREVPPRFLVSFSDIFAPGMILTLGGSL